MSLTASMRVEEWRWELLSESGGLVMDLGTAVAGQIRLNLDATVRGGGQVQIIETDELARVDWLHCLIRPVWRCTAEGQEYETGFGVYIPVVAERAETDTTAKLQLRLLDRTSLLDEPCPDYVTVPAGANAVNTARNLLLANARGVPLSVTDSSHVLGSSMTWQPGTPYRQIVNEILRVAGYAAVWADRDGVIVVEPYVAPASRPVAYEFAYGETSIMSAGMSRVSKEFDVPNRVVVVGRSETDKPALVGIAVNNNSDDPLSYARRGRWVTRHFQEDATDQNVLNNLAQRHLLALSTPGTTFKVSHAFIPDIWLGSRIEASTQSDVLQGTVNEMQVTCVPGGLVTAVWDAVNTR